jgi:outer membrane lipoprotein-sorting protein
MVLIAKQKIVKNKEETMKKTYISFMSNLFIWLLIITPLFTQEKKVTLLEEVIAGIKYNESLLKDWRLTCIETIKPKDKPSWEEIWVWAEKGEKLYREKKEKDKNTPLSIVSFDGEVLRIWSNNNKAGIKVPTHKDFVDCFFITVGPLHLFKILRYLEKPLLTILEKEKGNITVNLSDKIEYINGHPCYLLEIIWRGKEIGNYYLEYQLWIDYQRGFRPIKMTEAMKDKNGNPHLKSIIEVEIEKFGENFWFPVKGKIEGWVYDEKSGIRAHTTYGLILKNIEINTELPDTFFKIRFPKGTMVYDDRTGVNYTIE